MSLYIYAENPELQSLLKTHLNLKHRWTDSGFDIPMLEGSWDSDMLNRNHGVKLGIHVAASNIVNTPSSCLLLPRSSIGTTPFRMTNSIGLIDQGYRGELQAKVDIISGVYFYEWESGTRMFQLCRRDFLPWTDIIIVNSLEDLPTPPDDRGHGGFGSTGR